MSVDIHAIKKQLDELEQDLTAQVPEHLFVQHILPLIAGDEGHNHLGVWNHLAGSIFNKMSVIDPGGKVLFTLPGIATSIATPVERDHRTAIIEIMYGFEMRSRVSPVLGVRWLDAALKDKITLTKRDVATLLLIDEILVRYGRQARLPPGFGKEQTSTAVAPGSDGAVSDLGDEF